MLLYLSGTSLMGVLKQGKNYIWFSYIPPLQYNTLEARGAIGYSWLDGLLRNPWSGVQTPQVLGYSGLRVAEPLVRGSNP